MTMIIVGDASTLADLEISSVGGEKRQFWATEAVETLVDPSSSAALAQALAGFEAEVMSQEPSSVLLVDDSDTALAAALVATKLLVPVAATAAATRPSSANGRLIAQLADAYTRPA